MFGSLRLQTPLAGLLDDAANEAKRCGRHTLTAGAPEGLR
jgi:hypothetical protein